MRKLIVSLILIISLTACHPSGEEVAGKYYAKHNKGIEYIEMRVDGTFTQYFKTDTIEESNEGDWEFERKKGQWKLEFDGYIAYVTPCDEELSGKSGYASVYWELDKLLFFPDFEEYNYYRMLK
jgi:hypothetical protein